MPCMDDWLIFGELVFERYLKRQGYAVNYDWLGTWSLVVTGISLRRSL